MRRYRSGALDPLQDRRDVGYRAPKYWQQSTGSKVLGSVGVARRADVTTEPDNGPNMGGYAAGARARSGRQARTARVGHRRPGHRSRQIDQGPV